MLNKNKCSYLSETASDNGNSKFIAHWVLVLTLNRLNMTLSQLLLYSWIHFLYLSIKDSIICFKTLCKGLNRWKYTKYINKTTALATSQANYFLKFHLHSLNLNLHKINLTLYPHPT